MSNRQIELAINKLGIEFERLDLSFHKMENGRAGDITSYLPGSEMEDVQVCVFKGHEIREDECYIGQPYSGYALR